MDRREDFRYYANLYVNCFCGGRIICYIDNNNNIKPFCERCWNNKKPTKLVMYIASFGK